MMIGNTTLGLFNSGLPSFPILGAPRYRNKLAHFPTVTIEWPLFSLICLFEYMNVFVVNKKLLWAFATLIKVQRSRVKDNASEDRVFLLLCIFSNLLFCLFLFLGCLQIAVSSFGEEDQHLGATGACVCELPARRLRCNLALSAVLPLCNFVFFALLSHVQSCLCAHVQHCHVFNRDLWAMIHSILVSVQSFPLLLKMYFACTVTTCSPLQT